RFDEIDNWTYRAKILEKQILCFPARIRTINDERSSDIYVTSGFRLNKGVFFPSLNRHIVVNIAMVVITDETLVDNRATIIKQVRKPAITMLVWLPNNNKFSISL